MRMVRAKKIVKDMRILITAKTELENVKREINDRIEAFTESNRRLMQAVGENKLRITDWSLRYDGYEAAIDWDRKITVKIDKCCQSIQSEITKMEINLNEFTDEEIGEARKFMKLESEDDDEDEPKSYDSTE